MVKPSNDPMPPGASVPDFRWNPNKPEESVEGLHTQTVSFAKQKIDWYYNEAEKNGTHSKRIRFLVVCLLTIGALWPLIEATGFGVGVHLPAWGYVLFVLAAGFSRSTASMGCPQVGDATHQHGLQFVQV
jgi:hypothetical protein